MITQPTLFPENRDLRRRVHGGEIFLLPASPPCLRLCELAVALTTKILGADFRSAHQTLTPTELFERVARLKSLVYESAVIRKAAARVITALGFKSGQTVFDPPRLRAVPAGGHRRPGAESAYSAHRDTWYANPKAQINLWLPLHDVTEAETFTLFPELFERAVDNNSSGFEYESWKKTVGFGRSFTAGDALYPSVPGWRVTGEDGDTFASLTAQLLVFSAAQLHQTNENDGVLTRFSLDFRVVDLTDAKAGLGAPDPDNKSGGSTLPDYIRLDTLEVLEK